MYYRYLQAQIQIHGKKSKIKNIFKYSQQDDDAIISWHWEVKAGPIGYQPPLQDGPTLVLKDLKQPGNYTFQLTVEDSDHVKNSTTANITVLNPTDYPPEANAGEIGIFGRDEKRGNKISYLR